VEHDDGPDGGLNLLPGCACLVLSCTVRVGSVGVDQGVGATAIGWCIASSSPTSTMQSLFICCSWRHLSDRRCFVSLLGHCARVM
jgi:hypothetical protein